MQASAAGEMSRVLLDQADRLFRQHVTQQRLLEADAGAWSAGLWEEVEAAGLPRAMVAEAAGGVGLPAADVMRLIRLTGYHALPLPLAETMLAAALWAEVSGEAVDGPMTLAPTNARDAVAVRREGNDYVLEGEARGVPWAAEAARVLLLARDAAGAPHLVLLPRLASNAPPRRNLAFEPRANLALSGVRVPGDAVRPAPDVGAEGMLPLGALARAQQMAGAIERSLDYALAYANERKQFGRPIGKFQAVQHMLADAAGHYAAAAAAADLAAEAYGTAGFVFAAAVAKSRAGEAAGKVAEVAHQVFGAMGFTQEHPLHFATRRLWSWRDEFGNESYWQERIGRLVCGRGGEALWPMLAGA
jgi:acyl-CoA dehydrogenase